MLDRSTIELIMDTAKVEEVVGDFVALRKRGVNMIGLCPFHNEKTPSFTVSPSKNLWKCFGCGKGGKPVHFIMEHEQLSYPDALRWLAKKYHIEIKERELTDEEKREESIRESLFIINQYALQFFNETLHSTDEGKAIGLNYFRHRSLSMLPLPLLLLKLNMQFFLYSIFFSFHFRPFFYCPFNVGANALNIG